MRVVDLRSDTVTKPTVAMRQAMFDAIVGDDVMGEDPTVISIDISGSLKFETYAAKVFGKEAALYLPTATMGNLASVMAHCYTRGDEVILGDLSHIHVNEQGGIAQLAGVHHKTIRTNWDGTLPVDEIVKSFRSDDIHYPKTGLICLENTHNICGGTVLAPSYLQEVGQVARSKGVPLHMDGARIFNAAIHLGVSVATLLKDCDSVSACLSKGLGAPLGTIVAGSNLFINRVLRNRKALGGAMRQVGVVAATGYVAMTTMVERMEDDHTHVRNLATAINNLEVDVLSVNMATVQTNILKIRVNPEFWTPDDLSARLKRIKPREEEILGEAVSVLCHTLGSEHIRVVFHADISGEDAGMVVQKFTYIAQEKAKNL